MMHQCCGYHIHDNDNCMHRCHRLVNLKNSFCNKHVSLFNKFNNSFNIFRYYVRLLEPCELSKSKISILIDFYSFIYENDIIFYKNLNICKMISEKTPEFLLTKSPFKTDEYVDVLTKTCSKCIEIQHNHHNDWT